MTWEFFCCAPEEMLVIPVKRSVVTVTTQTKHSVEASRSRPTATASRTGRGSSPRRPRTRACRARRTRRSADTELEDIFNGKISRTYSHLKKGNTHTYNVSYRMSYSTRKHTPKKRRRRCFPILCA